MHTLLTLRPQATDPTTAADQIAIYNKLVTGIPEIFYRPNSNQTPIQMTYPSLLTDSSNAQYSFIAGPLLFMEDSFKTSKWTTCNIDTRNNVALC